MVDVQIPVINQKITSFHSLTGFFGLNYTGVLTAASLSGKIGFTYFCEGGCDGSIDIVVNGARIWSRDISGGTQLYTVDNINVSLLLNPGTNEVDVVVNTFGIFHVDNFNVTLVVNASGNIMQVTPSTNKYVTAGAVGALAVGALGLLAGLGKRRKR